MKKVQLIKEEADFCLGSLQDAHMPEGNTPFLKLTTTSSKQASKQQQQQKWKNI